MSFQRYNTEDSVVSSELVVRGLWGGDCSRLLGANMITPLTYTEYYLPVYNQDPTTPRDRKSVV